MADIPQELMDEAEALDRATRMGPMTRVERLEAFARALMARDQRAADTARTWTQEVHIGDGEYVTRPASGDQIASAILTYGASSNG